MASKTTAVLKATDLLALIRETVPVARHGARHHGPCPFCDHESDRFEVGASDGFFYCQDCNRDGDAVEWLMITRMMSRREAVRHLEERLQLSSRNA